MNRRSHPGLRQDGLAVLSLLTSMTGAVVLLGQALVAGDDMVLLQFEGRGAGSTGNFVAGALVGMVLLGVGVVAAARISAPDDDQPGDWPGALLLAGVGLAVLTGSLLAMAATQWSLAMSVADAALVDGATAPGQWVTLLTALVLAAATVPCVLVGARRLRGTHEAERRTPV